MAAVPYDGVDELLFNMYKQELLKYLRSRMDPNMLRALARLKDCSASSSDIGCSKMRIESLLACIIAGEELAAASVLKTEESGLKVKLQCLFGHVLSDNVISGVVALCASQCANKPQLHQDYENLIVELLKLLADSSCFKLNDYQMFTPPLKRKVDGICESPVLPLFAGKHQAKKPNCMQQTRNADAKVLFPEVAYVEIVKGHSNKVTKEPEDVVFVKEVNQNDKLNKVCNRIDAMYNEAFLHGKKVDQEHVSKEEKHGPSFLSFVSEDDPKLDAAQASKFHVTPLQKRYYDAVCSLASSNHARSVAVDIGGCFVNFFALGDSMAPGKQVCSFVINCLCRKYFLDERPTKSRKHYFFSSISEVFMSDFPDYSFVEYCFSRAGTVLPLHRCDMLLFPVLFENHWFLFVVDLENKLWVFLDSYYSRGDSFCIRTRQKLKESFRHAWDLFVGKDIGFDDFRTSYARVPKQDNQVDCGVFMIKFMEVWKFGCDMLQVFSQQDILNIRVQIVNCLLFSKHNAADVNIVKNFNANGVVL